MLNRYNSGLVLAMVFLFSCTSQQGIFSAKKSPHATYGDRIEDAGLRSTSLGTSWFAAAQRSLVQPVAVNLPYMETGYFAQEEPRAGGYRFALKRGEQVQITVATVPSNGLLFFTELWQPGEGEAEFVTAADTSGKALQFEAVKDGQYILRIQPELLKSVEYTIRITTAPSLAFPVRASDQPRITSYWGADRDGGRRSHEGVDIFAKRHTPLVAAANGRITRVAENTLGGKVVFLRPDGKSYNLYYAHLDSQLVSAGQEVKTGDVVGLMGNTGNARTTAPHLHFGIYTSDGAVDPLPFIDRNRAAPKPVTADTDQLNKFLRTQQAVTIYTEASTKSTSAGKAEAGTLVKVLAGTDNWYRVFFSQTEGFVPANNLTAKNWKKQQISRDTRLLDQPSITAPALQVLKPGTEVIVWGKENSFLRVSHGNSTGWIATN